MKRNGAKGGRKSARKAQRLARSKTNGNPSVLPSAAGEFVVVHRDLTNRIVDWRLLDDYEFALRDLLAFYDHATGQSVDHSGYSSADVLRIEEIRKLAAGG